MRIQEVYQNYAKKGRVYMYYSFMESFEIRIHREVGTCACNIE